MNYNYPITPNEFDSVKTIVESMPSGNISSYFPLLFCIVSGVAIMITVFMSCCDYGISVDDRKKIPSRVFLVFLAGFILSLYFVGVNNEGEVKAGKERIIESVQGSIEDDDKYDVFQASVSRYLVSQNIDLEENCTKSKGDSKDNLNDHRGRVDDSGEQVSATDFELGVAYQPRSSILCSNNNTSLFGTVDLTDNDDKKRRFVYETSASSDDPYLLVKINEIPPPEQKPDKAKKYPVYMPSS